MQLADEILGAAPVDADVAILEIRFQVPARALRLQDAALLRVDLHGDVGVAAARAGRALLAHDAAEEHAEVPVVHPEAEEEQRGVGQRAAHRRRDQVVVAGDADQVVEVVVLGQHQRVGVLRDGRRVVDQRPLGSSAVAGLRS